MRSPELRFKIGAKKIQVFTLDQIKALLAKSKGQPKLHILLGMNCGMGASDISAIKQTEVDWECGVITRKRVKTSEAENVPTVRYKLWEPTLCLSRQFNTARDPVLTTREGGEWAFRRLRADGSLHKNDNVAPPFRRVLKSCGLLGKGLSQYSLRKTSATRLESHPEYGRYVSHFLGHSPIGTAARNYAAPSDELFDTIITWLGSQYGI
jgi:integrase